MTWEQDQSPKLEGWGMAWGHLGTPLSMPPSCSPHPDPRSRRRPSRPAFSFSAPRFLLGRGTLNPSRILYKRFHLGNLTEP